MEMLFCSTVVGLPFLLPPMILTGELLKAWNSCSEVDQLSNNLPFFFVVVVVVHDEVGVSY